MTLSSPDHTIRRILAAALIAFPSALILVHIMHFRYWEDFFNFRAKYIPAAPDRVVAALIAGHNRWPLIHDPHIIGYLALPVLPLCAFALYLLGRARRPFASAIALMITITGTIYLGGVFAMWTAFYRGIGLLSPENLAGATVTFQAMTAPQGAFLLTTSLAKLAIIGLMAQALTLAGSRTVPIWSPVCVALGCCFFLAFWDLDNWMMIGTLLIRSGPCSVNQLGT